MNRLRSFAWLATLALSLLAAARALADAHVQVEAEGAVIHVSAEIETRVDRDTAWRVLSDYNRWTEFVPDLLISKVVSQPGEPLRLGQRARIPWLPNFPVVMVSEVEENPPKSIRLRRLAGNVRSFTGEWQIQGKMPVRLVYRSTVEPGFPVPPQMSIEIFRNDAKVRLEAMAREMARLADAGAK